MKTYRFTLKRELLHDGEPVKIHKAKEAAAYIAKNVFPEGELFRESCYILTRTSMSRSPARRPSRRWRGA